MDWGWLVFVGDAGHRTVVVPHEVSWRWSGLMGVDHKFLTGKQAAAYKADGMFSFLNWFRSGTSLQKPQTTNALAGKPLRYLIGTDPPPDRGVEHIVRSRV